MSIYANSNTNSHQHLLWDQLIDDLKTIAKDYTDVVFANSLAAEDMLIQHAISTQHIPIASFMLNTGRLHAETLELLARVQTHYDATIQVLEPDTDAVNAHVAQYGAYAFYDSLELRQACCQLRKVAPLKAYLKNKSAWITGQRREQSGTRQQLKKNEQDHHFGLKKFNPLCDWTEEHVWDLIHDLSIPYNPLHDQGYPSIGCDPCTRAIRPGEDIRAGRWWWEQRSSIECGLHSSPITSSLSNQDTAS